MRVDQGYCTVCKSIVSRDWDVKALSGLIPTCGEGCRYDNGQSALLITQDMIDAPASEDDAYAEFSDEQINEAFHANTRAKWSPTMRAMFEGMTAANRELAAYFRRDMQMGA